MNKQTNKYYLYAKHTQTHTHIHAFRAVTWRTAEAMFKSDFKANHNFKRDTLSYSARLHRDAQTMSNYLVINSAS